MDNQLATFIGGPIGIKKTEGNLVTVGGNLVRFSKSGDTDFHGDFFDSQTNFMFKGQKQVPTMFEHGMNQFIGSKQLGLALIEMTEEEIGIMIDTQLDASDQFNEMILEQIVNAKMGWSSGAMPSTVRRSETEGHAIHIDQWGIGEASLTFLPAEPANIATIKYLDIPQRFPVALPDPVKTDLNPVQTEDDKTAEIVDNGKLLRLKAEWLHNQYVLRKA